MMRHDLGYAPSDRLVSCVPRIAAALGYLSLW